MAKGVPWTVAVAVLVGNARANVLKVNLSGDQRVWAVASPDAVTIRDP